MSTILVPLSFVIIVVAADHLPAARLHDRAASWARER